jgi:hypothetical protein
MILESRKKVEQLQVKGVDLVKNYIKTPIEQQNVEDNISIFLYIKNLFCQALIGSKIFDKYVTLSNFITSDKSKLEFFTSSHTKKEIQLFLENY